MACHQPGPWAGGAVLTTCAQLDSLHLKDTIPGMQVMAASGSHLSPSLEKLPYLAGHLAQCQGQQVASEWLTVGIKGSHVALKEDQIWDGDVLWSSLWDQLISQLSFHLQTILLYLASLP